MKHALKVTVALMVSGLSALFVYAVYYFAPRYDLEFFAGTAPFIVLISLIIGWPLYIVLARFTSLNLPICIAAGAAVGSSPGVLVWALAGRGFGWLIVIWGAFGCVGGLVFFVLSKLLQLRW
jgi:hypothetical protein